MAAALALKDTAGPRGSSVHFSGSGYKGGEEANLYYGGACVQTVPCDADGNCKGEFVVPTNQSTGAKAVALQGQTGAGAATGTFTAS